MKHSTLLASNLLLELKIGSFPADLTATGYKPSGSLALVFTSSPLGEPLATASVNVPGVSENLPFGEFVCKSYSENFGMYEFLTEQGYATPTGKLVQLGHTFGHVLALAPELVALLKETTNEA